MDANTNMMKLREILSGKMPFRIFVLLQLEMTGSTAMRFEFQGLRYHRMTMQWIYVYRSLSFC